MQTPSRNATESFHHKPATSEYAIQLKLEYRVSHPSFSATGIGWTVSLSSRYIRFRAERLLPPGLDIEVRIQWPAILNNSVGLTLRVKGQTIDDGHTSVIVISRYEFYSCPLSKAKARVHSAAS
jgi:hypothetical protein